MDGFKKFISEYKGAIIGGIIALLVFFTGLYQLILAIVLISIGIYFGNYVQRNKEHVKDKLRYFIDKM